MKGALKAAQQLITSIGSSSRKDFICLFEGVWELEQGFSILGNDKWDLIMGMPIRSDDCEGVIDASCKLPALLRNRIKEEGFGLRLRRSITSFSKAS